MLGLPCSAKAHSLSLGEMGGRQQEMFLERGHNTRKRNGITNIAFLWNCLFFRQGPEWGWGEVLTQTEVFFTGMEIPKCSLFALFCEFSWHGVKGTGSVCPPLSFVRLGSETQTQRRCILHLLATDENWISASNERHSPTRFFSGSGSEVRKPLLFNLQLKASI